jgi:hypothetical protein
MEMIDIENEIFDEVSKRVRERFPNVFMTGEYVKSPSSFPCTSLVEMDNATFDVSMATDGENHAVVMFELNVYSNKTKGKKAECKAIVAFIDEILMGFNFSRIMLQPISNPNDATIYRMLGRYRAVVSKNKTIFRR